MQKNDLEGIADYICNSLYAPVAAQKILKKLQDSFWDYLFFRNDIQYMRKSLGKVVAFEK